MQHFIFYNEWDLTFLQYLTFTLIPTNLKNALCKVITREKRVTSRACRLRGIMVINRCHRRTTVQNR